MSLEEFFVDENGNEYKRFWFVTIQKRNEFKIEEEIELSHDNEKVSVLHIFVRDFEKPFLKHHFTIRDYKPYFFIKKDFLLFPDGDRILDNERIINVESKEKGNELKTLDNIELLKLSLRNTEDVTIFKTMKIDDELLFEPTYEADVLFQLRFLYDKKIRNGVLIPISTLENGKLPKKISHKYIKGF